MRSRTIALALTGVSVLLVAPPSPTGAAQATLDAASRIDTVTIYATRAKVSRQATATLRGGQERVRVATLPATVDPDSVQVRSKTVRIERVSVALARGRLPRQAEAEKLVAQIEAVDDKLRAVRDEARIVRKEQSFVRGLSVSPPPRNEKRAKPEGIYAASWRQILRWIETHDGQARKRLDALRVSRKALAKVRHKLVVAARQLDLSAVERPQLVVTATVKGRAGRHTLAVSYLVSRVTWRPSYDLRYDPQRKRVEATYYADVTQRTGEDWKNASLRFSTGRALSLVAVPELPTWLLGRKRDFIPRPRRRVERAPGRWVASARPVVVSSAVRRLRRLLSRTSGSRDTAGARGESSGSGGLDDLLDGEKSGRKIRTRRPPRRPRYRRSRRPRKRRPPEKSMTVTDYDIRPPPAPSEASPAPVYAESARAPSGRVSSSRRPRPVDRIPWTEVGYRPPYLPPDSPAAAAKGYLFTIYAPGHHDVPATGAKRRVPLLRTRFRVSPVHRLTPGKSKLAYLLAVLTNTTGRPILRGHANIFAGSMFTGDSFLNTSLPGHKMSLPLGVDDSVKVERHLVQRTVTQGVLFKDDVTEYTVKIEIANHHRYPITVDVRDQVPRARGRKIEIGGLVYRVAGKKVVVAKATKHRTPGWTGVDDQGRVVWKGTIRGRKVKKISFSFQITRPKDWLLRQSGG